MTASKVTTNKAEKAIQLLTAFLESQEDVGYRDFIDLANLENDNRNKEIQTSKITERFIFILKSMYVRKMLWMYVYN